MIPIIGETCVALVRQHVKVLSINADDTANVALLTETPLANGIVIIANNVPFENMSSGIEDE